MLLWRVGPMPSGFRPEWQSEVRKIGIIPIVAEDGDLKSGRTLLRRKFEKKRDEEEIVDLEPLKKSGRQRRRLDDHPSGESIEQDGSPFRGDRISFMKAGQYWVFLKKEWRGLWSTIPIRMRYGISSDAQRRE